MVYRVGPARESRRPVQSRGTLLPGLGDPPRLQRSGPLVSRRRRFRLPRGSKQSGRFLLQRSGRPTRLHGSCPLAAPRRATRPARGANQPGIPLRAGKRPAAQLRRCLHLVFPRARRRGRLWRRPPQPALAPHDPQANRRGRFSPRLLLLPIATPTLSPTRQHLLAPPAPLTSESFLRDKRQPEARRYVTAARNVSE